MAANVYHHRESLTKAAGESSTGASRKRWLNDDNKIIIRFWCHCATEYEAHVFIPLPEFNITCLNCKSLYLFDFRRNSLLKPIDPNMKYVIKTSGFNCECKEHHIRLITDDVSLKFTCFECDGIHLHCQERVQSAPTLNACDGPHIGLPVINNLSFTCFCSGNLRFHNLQLSTTNMEVEFTCHACHGTFIFVFPPLPQYSPAEAPVDGKLFLPIPIRDQQLVSRFVQFQCLCLGKESYKVYNASSTPPAFRLYCAKCISDYKFHIWGAVRRGGLQLHLQLDVPMWQVYQCGCQFHFIKTLRSNVTYSIVCKGCGLVLQIGSHTAVHTFRHLPPGNLPLLLPDLTSFIHAFNFRCSCRQHHMYMSARNISIDFQCRICCGSANFDFALPERRRHSTFNRDTPHPRPLMILPPPQQPRPLMILPPPPTTKAPADLATAPTTKAPDELATAPTTPGPEPAE